jgi:TolB protein
MTPDHSPRVGAGRFGIIAIAAVATLVTLDARLSQAPQPASQPQSQQPSEVTLVISSDGTVPNYAVPDFVGASADAAEVGKMIAQVLYDDLDFEREFRLIPRDTYASIPVAQPGGQIPFASWRELGADGVVSGTVQRNGDNLRVDVRLFSVRTQQAVFTQGYDGPARSARQLAHTISDAIHQQQRRLRGVARTKLAFISDRDRERLVGTVEKREVKEVYIVDYDGANPRRITTSRSLNLNPSWAPDGRALAYTGYNASGADIIVSRIYEGLLQRPAKGQGNNYLPVFSPDGTRIAFMSARDGNAEIYVMNVDGTNMRRLTNHPADDVTPTWSPSGGQIAFTSDRSGRPQIYTMNADGTGVERISNETEADRPTWSPSPYNEIAFTAKTGTWYDIKIHNVATRQVAQITDGQGSNESPAFSPTGRHLAFTSTRTGSKQIFTIGRDGKGLRQVTREGNNQTASWSSN